MDPTTDACGASDLYFTVGKVDGAYYCDHAAASNTTVADWCVRSLASLS